MPKKFTSGRAVAAVDRKSPLPKPTSTSTGRSLPNSSRQSIGGADSPRGTAGNRYGASWSRGRFLMRRTKRVSGGPGRSHGIERGDRHSHHLTLEHQLIVHEALRVE